MINLLASSDVVAQTQTSQPSNPLISKSGEDAVYVGVGGFAIILALIIGAFSRRFMAAIFVSLVLSAVIILLVFFA
jgi:hypothetical protein